MASAEAEIRHVFGATCLTEGSIGAAPPDIVKLSAPKRHLIKIRTFIKKIDSHLEKYKFARRFEGLRLDQIS